MGLKNPTPGRLNYVRKAVGTAISDELDAVEDVVGYVRPTELLRVMFDIAVRYGKDSSVSVDEIEGLFENAVNQHSQFTIVVGPMAEA